MLNKKTIFAAFMLSGLMLSGPAAAGNSPPDVQDFGVWGNITATGNWGFLNRDNPNLAKWKWWAEGQGRFGDNASHFSQSLLRPGLGYQLTPTISLWAGYAYAPTEQPYVRVPFNEQRVWQQVLYREKYSIGTVQWRSRLEQRMAPQLGEGVGVRYRQLLKLSVPLSFAPGFSWVVQDEVFVAMNTTDWINRNGLDNNRFFTGVGYAITKEITGEVGYMNHYIWKKGPTPNLMDHVLSINVLANF
jgi:hypothetical protein